MQKEVQLEVNQIILLHMQSEVQREVQPEARQGINDWTIKEPALMQDTTWNIRLHQDYMDLFFQVPDADSKLRSLLMWRSSRCWLTR